MEERPIPGWIKPFILTGFLFLALYLGSIRLGPLPPMGKFANPFSGFWRNADNNQVKDRELQLSGLHEPVTVVYDKRGVPHIFAQNSHDLFMAQGYITARDRLWQMEIHARASAGRLAEILGPALLEKDRFQRRLGIPQAANADLELIKKNADSWEAVSAYASGVNVYIQSLSKSQYPLEYKLLDYAPESWSPLNSALIIKNMQWLLSGGGEDLPLTNTLNKFGVEFLHKFYPLLVGKIEPVIPAGTPWDFLTPRAPFPIIDSALKYPLFPELPVPSMLPNEAPLPVPEIQPDPGNGSNNFVLAGFKTKSGSPILANDPHLDLSLPSLWYEVQLSAPGISVYGVSLPGTPTAMIGFNRKISWGLTNGHDDVYDWYRVAFRDSTLTEYMHAGQWKPVRKDIQTLQIRGAETIYDTVIFTHHGPLVLKSQERPLNRNSPSMHVLHWAALEPSDELQAFLKIMKSSDIAEFTSALQSFHCPSQNFAFASVNGDIGMFHHGKFPRKWSGQGRFIMDGSDPGNDWSGWIPESDLPKIKNPTRGWLFSANQAPTDSTYPYYLGSDFYDDNRVQRLGQLLAQVDSVTDKQAFEIMLDDQDLIAAEILPTLIKGLGKSPLSPTDSAAIELLTKWDYSHGPLLVAPALYDRWWRLLYRSVWIDEFGRDSLRYEWPSKDRTYQLMVDEPTSEWFDDITTPAKENLNFLIARSFRQACASLRKDSQPEQNAPQWKNWSEYRPVQIRHMAHIDAFGSLDISTSGCINCINAQKTFHGPSWRMVVTMDKVPHAIGIYPGGQSGNPGSPHYDEFISDWASGHFYELNFLTEPGGPMIIYNLQLRGK
jgi:penicillin G amidase